MNWIVRLLLVALGVGLFAFAVHVDFPLCPLAGTFGVPCPGCGLTRATLALLHGDVRAALRFHPLVWLLTPLFAAFMAALLLELVEPRWARVRPRWRWERRALGLIGSALFVATFGVWIARFTGHFGGPAPVTSLRDWLAMHR